MKKAQGRKAACKAAREAAAVEAFGSRFGDLTDSGDDEPENEKMVEYSPP